MAERRYAVECVGTHPGAGRTWTEYEWADRPGRAADRIRRRLDQQHPDEAPHHTHAELDDR